MDNVIVKTKDLIEVLDSSDFINKLNINKHKVLINNELMSLIDKYNKSNDDYEKMDLKIRIYKYTEYKEYMDAYNIFFRYILKINGIYKRFNDRVGGCHESN